MSILGILFIVSLIFVVILVRVLYVFLPLLAAILTVAAAVSVILSLAILPRIPEGGELDIKVWKTTAMSLDDSVDRWWLDSMSVAFEADGTASTICSASFAVIESENCSSLPVANIPFSETKVYVTRGSLYNITILDAAEVNKTVPHVWIIRTIETFEKLVEQFDSSTASSEHYMCHKEYSDAACFPLKDKPTGSSVIYQVLKDGYYTLLLSNSNDTAYASSFAGLSIENTRLFAYDIDAIRESYPTVYPWQHVDGLKQTKLKISRPFNFSTGDCALLSFTCSGDSILTLSNFTKRWDISVLTAILHLPIVCTLGCVALTTHISCKCCACCKLHRKEHPHVYVSEDHVI